MIEPPIPSAIVAPIDIGSGPGTARRASAPTIRPPTRSRMMKRSRPMRRPYYLGLGRRFGCGLQLPPQVLDLVPELGGVLETQLLGGGEHLLLELNHELLELGRRHS